MGEMENQALRQRQKLSKIFSDVKQKILERE
jgi:hypothetical protein